MKNVVCKKIMISAMLAAVLLKGGSYAAYAGNNAAADPSEDQAEGTYRQDEVLASFDEDMSEDELKAAVAGLDGVDYEATIEANGELEDSSFITLKLEDGTTVDSALDELDTSEAFTDGQPNYTYVLMEDDSSALWTQIDTDDTYASSLTNLSRVGIAEAWEYVKTNGTVTVAVIDTGCRMTHEDLDDNVLADYAWDFYTDSALTGDKMGHGTHVCGIVAAEANNGVGVAGASYNAKLLPLNVFNNNRSCSTSDLVEAYDYVIKLAKEHADLNIRVVNLSVGTPEESEDDLSDGDKLLFSSIDEAYANGIVTVCAAGNRGNESDATAYTYPSDYETCVSVTNLSLDGYTPNSTSSYNEAKDICAPGTKVYSTYNDPDTKYREMTGTSMAAPLVAGVLALEFAADPDLTAQEAVEILYETAETGTLQEPEGREGLYGVGILDAAAAVKKVLNIEDDTTPSTDGQDNGTGETEEPEEPAVQFMYRLYNPNSGEHFYTASTSERDNLIKAGWNYEGIGWTAPLSSNTPVYRLYNPNPGPNGSGEHHYTTSRSEKDKLVKAGWKYEGIGWYSDDAKGVALYRQYNPNAYNCNHNYTASKSENDYLVSIGWRDEGIAWYGVKG